MNKLERIIARIAGKGDNKTLKTETRIEGLLKDIIDRMDGGMLPEAKASDAGKYVYVRGANDYALAVIPEPPVYDLPVPTVSDAGKVLAVDEEGFYILKTL